MMRRLHVQRLVAHADDAGSVSIEAAMGLFAIVSAMLMAAWFTGLLLAQLAVGEAARAAVRVAARGDDVASVITEVHRLVPQADVVIDHEGSEIHVAVSRTMSPPGGLGRLGTVRLSASSYAANEAQP